MVLGDAAVIEHDRGGIGGADAELVLDAHNRHSGRVVLDHEGLDPGTARALIDGSPDYDEAFRLLRRDLPAVQKILVPLSTQ